MLVTIGQRTSPQDVVDALVECHGRIRRFLILASELARQPAPPAEARELASQIRHYFVSAFPLHVADEEESLVPHLANAGAAVAHALMIMRRDHAEHDAAVKRLVDVCAAIEREPARATELAEPARELAALVEPHLALEERVIFPAIRALPQATRESIRAAMRARRDTPGVVQ